MVTFFEKIAEHAARIPERVALFDERCRISYGEMPSLIEAYEKCLIDAGLNENSTVGLNIKDDISHILICLALLKMRAHQAVLASHESDVSHQNLSRRLGVSHVVRTGEGFDPLNPSLDRFEIVSRSKTENLQEGGRQSGAVLYVATSGTTGLPRIVPLPEQLLALQYTHQSLAFQQERYRKLKWDNCLVLSSCEHSITKRYRLRSLWVGDTSVFAGSDERSASDLADLIAKRNVTALLVSSQEAQRLASGGRRVELQTSLHVTGMRVPWDLRKAILQNLCENLYVFYGASEVSFISVAVPGEHDERESVGLPLAHVAVEIVDKEGRSLPIGEIGEIRIRTPATVHSYFDDPVESAARFRDGWCYPGDMAALTDTGHLIIHGRKDDMMNLNGINIYPAEIERVFEAHPGVAAAAAFPLKSRIHGDIPAVALELVPGAIWTERDFLQYGSDRLGLRSPRKIVIREALPRNHMGKVLKAEIAATLLSPLGGEKGV
jgi:long-chain acyl-CoA synthetase